MPAKMRSSLFAFWVGLISILGCEPASTNQFWLDNQSDSTLYVRYRIFRDTAASKLKLLFVAPHLKDTILEWGGLGKAQDFGDNLIKNFDSLTIFFKSPDEVRVKKDYSKRSNWAMDIEDNFYVKYFFVLKNEDLK